MMIKIKFLLLFLFFSHTVHQIKSMEKDSLENIENGLLWEISGNELAKPSYLLATKHDAKKDFLDSISGFYDAMQRSEQLIVEYDLNALQDTLVEVFKNESKTPRQILMPEDTTYFMLYKKKEYHYVDSVMRKGNSNYQKYIPAFWINIYEQFEYSKSDYNDMNTIITEGMDAYLPKLALQSGKAIINLDSLQPLLQKAEKEYNEKYEVSLEKQAENLLKTIKRTKLVYIGKSRMDPLYYSQQLQAFEITSMFYYIYPEDTVLASKALRELEEQEVISYKIVERNNHWMTQIPALIQKTPSLIAVGAAHLPGEEGLIFKLRQLGYTVEPIRKTLF